MSLDFFFPILCVILEMAIDVIEVLANATVVIKLQCTSVSNQYLYTLNLHSVICQLYVSESGGKISMGCVQVSLFRALFIY